jgi:DNA-binding NarL/FixJ family response regulator
MWRLGMRTALEADRFVVVAQAGTAREAVAAACAARPDACVIDASIPGGGLEAARQIKRRVPESGLVVLSAAPNYEELLETLRAGASGYLHEDTEPSRWSHTLEAVLAGEVAIPRAFVAILVDDLNERDGRRREAERRLGVRLTTREWQVMDLLRRRYSTGETAAQLRVSAVTVRRHVADVVQKLGARDREAALLRFVEAQG